MSELLPNPIVTGAPTLSEPTVGQNHATTPQSIETGAPTIPAVTIGQIHVTEPLPIVTGAATLTQASVGPDQGSLWPFAWNWADGVDEILEYRTEIITSRGGREQRRALRQTPRRSLEGEMHAYGEAYRRFARILNSRFDRPFSVQYAMQSATTASPLNALERTVTMATAEPWVVAGARGILINTSLGQSEIVEFEAVDGLNVTIAGVAIYSWGAGTQMFRVLEASLSANLKIAQQTNTVAVAKVRFEEDPGQYAAAVAPHTGETYNGRELFTKRPNWATPPALEWQSSREPVDFGFGRARDFFPIGYNTRMTKLTFLNRTRAETYAVVDFFNRMKGSRGEFYMPTWVDELKAISALASAGTTLQIAGRETHFAFKDDLVHKTVAVSLRNGTLLLRTIVGSAWFEGGSGDYTQFTMDAPWGQNVALADIRSIMWVPVWRLASDKLTIEWLTDTTAQFAMSAQTLEVLEAE